MRTPRPLSWIYDQAFLLLPLTMLFWAGNAVVGRGIAGEMPPVLLAQLRWLGAFVIVLPFAWPHLKRERALVRKGFRTLTLLALSRITIFNTLQYASLQFTTATNVVLLQSVMPLIIAAWSFGLLGERLTGAQMLGIAVSGAGIVAIVSGGSPASLFDLDLNRGDALFLLALVIYGFYSALLKRRPPVHWLTLLAVTVGWGAVMLLPATLVEYLSGARAEWGAGTLAALGYVVLFPSVLSYVCFNRGVELIGPNRAGPFFHLVPIFGVALAATLLGETLRPFHAVGAVLIIGGVAVASRRPPRARQGSGGEDRHGASRPAE